MDEIVFVFRLVAWICNIIAFWVYLYKYVLNNWTGKVHDLNWPACGCWAASGVYSLALGLLAFDHHNKGGYYSLFPLPLAFFLLYIALFKVPMATELKPFEDDDEL